MEKPLILVGGGGHCKSVIDVAETAGRPIKGILDIPDLYGCECLGYKVIGSDIDIPRYVNDCEYLITLGFITNSDKRRKIQHLIKEVNGQLALLQSPLSHVSSHASVGNGTVVCHKACINAGAHIGENCIINTASNIEHDVTIGDNVHISTGAMVNGGVAIGNDVFIGSGAIINNGVKITDNCIIGAGCVVNKDILVPGTYVGVPARKI